MTKLLTKEARNASRDYQFNSLLNSGYTRETYKGLEIFKNSKDLILKVFSGNASNPLLFYRYRTIEQLENKILEAKKNYDMREAWKAEQKEKNKGHKSGHAATAAAIREELKNTFKGFKFSVTSEQFAGGDAVRIGWINGPTTSEVEKITGKYQMGHFNGMEDIYEYSENPLNLPQVKYVTERREFSEEVKKQIETEICSLMDLTNLSNYRDKPENISYRIASKTSFPPSYESFKTVRTDLEAGSGLESFFKLEFVGVCEVKTETKTQVEEIKTTVKDGEIQVIEYSEKSFAVIGEKTKEIKEKLIELGGAYNRHLKCGAGFIFSNKRLENVIEYLKSLKEVEQVEEPQQEEKPTETTLKEEVNKTLDFFIDTDKKLFGEVTESTTQILEVQNYLRHPEVEEMHPLNICDPESGQYKEALKEYTNLEDITKAANSGQIISLYNLSQLLTTKH